MTTTTPTPPLGGTLYLRRDGDTLTLTRYEAGREPRYALAQRGVRDEASLSASLRSLLSELGGAVERETVQVYTCSAAVAVPLAEFQEEDSRDIFAACFAPSAGQRVFYDPAPSANAVLLYGIDESFCQAVEEVLGEGVHFVSALSPLLRHFAAKSAGAGAGVRIYLNRREGETDLFAFDGARLLLINSFATAAAMDAAYFALHTARTLSPQAAALPPLYVAGSEAGRTELVETLRKYDPEVYAIAPAAEFNRNPLATDPAVPFDLAVAILMG